MTALRVVLAGPEAALSFDPDRLSPRDAERWRRGFVREEKRREFEVSRALLAAEGMAGFEFGPGRNASLTHSHGHSAVAVAPVGCVVGVDLEWQRPRDIAGLEAWCYSEAEIAAASSLPAAQRADQFHLRWAIKEAGLKALGLRFPGGLREIEVVFDGDRPVSTRLPFTGSFRVAVWRPREGAVMAVTLAAEEGFESPSTAPIELRDMSIEDARWRSVADMVE